MLMITARKEAVRSLIRLNAAPIGLPCRSFFFAEDPVCSRKFSPFGEKLSYCSQTGSSAKEWPKKVAPGDHQQH
jgi:hypothetical protein